jgi:hypothetical protein
MNSIGITGYYSASGRSRDNQANSIYIRCSMSNNTVMAPSQLRPQSYRSSSAYKIVQRASMATGSTDDTVTNTSETATETIYPKVVSLSVPKCKGR